ncbi:MAG: 23S rRNA (pseudouridine(1915)-N(3))-methyltransferase RlmH [Flavobacteriia bacterium]|nr:MAG: 23S rRNA (pseudouridine(1915)-N(3))-methyltransferase RlmH [Flavobacteriia bacterium]
MTIKIISIGKTDHKALDQLIQDYLKRLKFYIKTEFVVVPDIKNRKSLRQDQQKNAEGALILKSISPGDFVVLLDEKGKQYTSKQFSEFLSKKMLSGLKQLVFVIGGPYGFSEEVYQKSQARISLSKMTFSHQMVRLFFVEQIYRAFTIIRNEPYHHD